MNWKQFLTEKNITEAEFAEKTVEEMASLRGEYEDSRIKELKNEMEKAATKEDVDALTVKFDAFLDSAKEVNDETIKSLKDSLKAQGEELTKMKENKNNVVMSIADSIEKQLRETIKANKSDFEKLKTEKGATMSMTLKAAGTILTSTNLTPVGNRIARTETDPNTIGFVRRNPFMLDLVSVGNTNAKVCYWVEMVNEDGTVAMTAEGSAKAQVDYDYVEASAQVRKATAYMKASKEMLDDVDNFVSDMRDDLVERIRLFVDNQILVGDGTGENLTGIAANATPFAAGALAASVDDAQETDCLRAAIAQVVRNEFYPTACVVHPDVMAKMDLTKATDGQYIIPPFKSADGLVISGVQIVSNTNVGADAFYVGDFTKYKVKVREDIDIQFGYENDDWTKNLITPLAEMRLVGYIPANHYGAIVDGTFTAAKAALETP
jgi:HK97 family phage major capsid protein